MTGKNTIVWLYNSRPNLKSEIRKEKNKIVNVRTNGEVELGLLAVIDGDALKEEGTKIGASIATDGVENEEALEVGAVVGELANMIKAEVADLFADDVVSLGELIYVVRVFQPPLLLLSQHHTSAVCTAVVLARKRTRSSPPPSSIVSDEVYTACDFNYPRKTCLCKLEWFGMEKHSCDYYHIKKQIESDFVDGANVRLSKSFLDLLKVEQQSKLKDHLKKYCQKKSYLIKMAFTELRETGICMRENPFYVDTVRRWYSMEMARVLTYIGEKIIQNACLLVEKIGQPLELDTDGIWCALPGYFPKNFTSKTKFLDGNKLLEKLECNVLLGNFEFDRLIFTADTFFSKALCDSQQGRSEEDEVTAIYDIITNGPFEFQVDEYDGLPNLVMQKVFALLLAEFHKLGATI
ncbi:hypothetical protein S245_009480, partial [Arachis hypogaea]